MMYKGKTLGKILLSFLGRHKMRLLLSKVLKIQSFVLGDETGFNSKQGNIGTSLVEES